MAENTMTIGAIGVPQASHERLVKMLASLSAEQQRAVEGFVRHLQEKDSQDSPMDFRTALDEFVREHSELLRRLAW
jgi:hypothetical protein